MDKDISLIMQAWVQTLKTGSAVIYENPLTGKRLRTKVIEVSPRGVVSTEVGEFKYPGIGDKVVGYGGTMGWLFPTEDISGLEIPKELNRFEKKKEIKLFCAAVVRGDVDLTGKIVDELLHIKNKYTKEA